MLLLREMQVGQKKPRGQLNGLWHVIVANLNLKWLSNHHQGALEQRSEAALWSTVDCCDHIEQILKFVIAKLGNVAQRTVNFLFKTVEKTNIKWGAFIRIDVAVSEVPHFTSLSHYRCCTVAPVFHPALCTAFVIHSRQDGFWFTFTGEVRSTRLGWYACGEICLGLQAVFSPAKVLGRALPPEKWCNAVWCKKKHTRDSPSQTPDKLLDGVSIGVRIRIYVLQCPAESLSSRQS